LTLRKINTIFSSLDIALPDYVNNGYSARTPFN